MKQRTRLLHSGDDLVTYNMTDPKKDDGDSDIQLHKLKPQEHFIEAQIQEGDTLQAIALRFYCSIAELKRINHIHKDNEIFARRIIKVPVTPYSVLTERIQTSQSTEPVPSTSSNASTNPLALNLNSNLPNGSPVHNNVLLNGDHDFAINCNAVVLNSTVAPSVIPYTDAEPNESLSEDTQLLPNKTKEPVEAVVVKTLTSQSADFGIKWFHLVTVMLVLGVVIPLVYVMFYLDKHEHSDVPPLHSNR